MIIRRFKQKDKKQLTGLIKKILQEIFLTKPKNITIDKSLFNKGAILYVAQHDSKIIGSIGLIKQKNKVARLKKMYLEKKFRGSGLAQKLYNKIRLFAKQKSYKRIILSTTPRMKAAIKFYQKQGFKEYRINKKKNQIFFCKQI